MRKKNEQKATKKTKEDTAGPDWRLRILNLKRRVG
jgi:hypothetical protein